MVPRGVEVLEISYMLMLKLEAAELAAIGRRSMAITKSIVAYPTHMTRWGKFGKFTSGFT